MHVLDGTIRAADPEDTLVRARRAAAAHGVTRLADVTDLDSVGLPVWQAIRPLGRSLSVSQGKGASHTLAAISALMESVEIDHAETHALDSEIIPLAGYVALADAVPLTGLPLLLDGRMDPEGAIEIIETRRLRDGAAALLPRAMVDLDFTIDFPGSELLVRSSNGLASGTGDVETLVHAICEAVERDNVSSWYLDHALRPETSATRLDPATIDDRWCLEQIERLRAAGLDLLVWRAEGRIDIPTFVASIVDSGGVTPYRQRASGYGCHLDPGIALSRAINEAAQSRLTAITGSRDDTTWAHYTDFLPADSETGRAWLSSVLEEPVTREFPRPGAGGVDRLGSLDDLLAVILERLEWAGFPDVYVTDLGRPGATQDAGFSVLHVTIPGLQVNARKFHALPDPDRLAAIGWTPGRPAAAPAP